MFALGFVSPVSVLAATSPSLGSAASYSILSSTYTNISAGTTINGDVGFTTGPAVAPAGAHTNYGSGAPYSAAGTDQSNALSALSSQPCDFTFGSATDLSLLSQPLTAGVYCVTGAQSIGTGGITLGSGTYVFRSTGALNTVANSHVTGGNACNIFWAPTATTLGANSTFLGTDIDASGITVGSTVSWTGRALSFGGTITTNADTISAPSCEAPVVTPAPTPINGDWTGWSACSVTACGETGTQTRTCTNPAPSNGGASCSGLSTQSCSTPVCATPTPVIPAPVPAYTPSPTITTPPAIVPVVVPKLPKTGFAPKEKNTLWNIIIPVGISAVILSFFLARKKEII